MARKRHDIENKVRILKKAEEKFRKFGYSKTSIEEIVSELGMSRNTLYNCFREGKQGILEALIQQQRIEMGENVQKVLQDEHKNFSEKYKLLLDVFFNSLVHSDVFISDLNKTNPELMRTFIYSQKKNIIEKVVQLFEEGQREGKIRKDVNLSFVFNFFALSYEGEAFYELFSSYPMNLQQARDLISTVMLEGLQVRTESDNLDL